MTGVVVVFAFIVAFSAIVCGHQGEDLPSFAARALRVVLRRPRRPSWAYGPIRARRHARPTESP